jgi:GNAT superfamily N-acetyltransferase
MTPSFFIRPIDPSATAELDLVAYRMQLTLMEVLGAGIGGSMYSIDWLRDRVRAHLDPRRYTGEVLVAEDHDGLILGHTITRVDTDPRVKGPVGLFSTTYVIHQARRLGVARALIKDGEQWLRDQRLTLFVTDTDYVNMPLLSLFGGLGYAVWSCDPRSHMVRLGKRDGVAAQGAQGDGVAQGDSAAHLKDRSPGEPAAS